MKPDNVVAPALLEDGEIISPAQDPITDYPVYPIKPDHEVDVCCGTAISPDVVMNEALSARVLTATKIAAETISALMPVYLDSFTTIKKADNSNDVNGTVFGIALNAGNVGESIQVRIFGLLEDAFFNFDLNQPLFLGSSGTIITSQPVSGVLTSIGFGIGPGAISINLQRPINL